MFPIGIGAGGRGGKLLRTAQQSIYHIGDDGDRQSGLTRPVYTVYSAGSPYSDTPNVDTPHYAGTDIAFVNGSPDTITSATIDFTTVFVAADVIICVGSPNANNLVVRTIAAAGVAAHTLTLTSSNALTNEAAGNYITMFKRVTPSGNVVYDELTKLYWLRYTTGGPALKVGAASDGKLNWWSTTKCYILHALAADLAMDATNKQIKIVGGSAESTKFKTGTYLQFAGFANSANNRSGGFRCDAITVSGSDLLLTLWTGYGTDGSQTGTTTNGNKIISGLTDTSKLRIGMAINGTNVGANSVIATIDSTTQVTGSVNSTGSASNTITFTSLNTEAAAGSRSIKIVCQSIFAYAAACNVMTLGGYTDWRIPNFTEMVSLGKLSANPSVPDATVFPSWNGGSGTYYWSSTVLVIDTTGALALTYQDLLNSGAAKTNTYFCALVRP